ncbi:CHAD domain-containing protein [Vacuolonema iberomarrocanum]|uniref:CHAD domain-containing protein n=1 Tax=Vacuolonema iberomarrocanum TaxID=3454632 RepID=UPI001A060AC7|nr:CHAD domain-containing protein [filamentous cyanobacterium LEGE 07170]
MSDPNKEKEAPSEATNKASKGSSQSTPKRDASRKPRKAVKRTTRKTADKTSTDQQAQAVADISVADISLGEYAHRVIREHYQAMVKCEKGVLADTGPEPLHQMRVSSRRLYTALSVFEGAIALPKAAGARRVRSLTRALGNLRDLDVQLQALREEYLPHLDGDEQTQLLGAIAKLERQRQKAKVKAEDTFSQSRYNNLKLSYEAWIANPRFTSLGTFPIKTVLPDLLSPLLSQSLLHPGWLISADGLTVSNAEVLHDLRKACKFARYQSDFFTTFYDKEFKDWVKGLKALQDALGGLQDIQVLQRILKKHHMSKTSAPQLHAAIREKEQALLASWESQRHHYIDTDNRYQLHRMLLSPTV